MKLSTAIRHAAAQCLITTDSGTPQTDGKFTAKLGHWYTVPALMLRLSDGFGCGTLTQIETTYKTALRDAWLECQTNYAEEANIAYLEGIMPRQNTDGGWVSFLKLRGQLRYDVLQHVACYIQSLEESDGLGFTGGHTGEDTGEDTVRSEGSLDIF